MNRTTLPRSPSASRRAAAGDDVQTFLLSAALGFLLMISGGWYLAGQVTLPVDDLLSSEVEMVAGAGHARAEAMPLATTPRAEREEWHFYIYTGAPLHDRDSLESARTRDPRDDG
jgi:hypothetical protein